MEKTNTTLIIVIGLILISTFFIGFESGKISLKYDIILLEEYVNIDRLQNKCMKEENFNDVTSCVIPSILMKTLILNEYDEHFNLDESNEKYYTKTVDVNFSEQKKGCTKDNSYCWGKFVSIDTPQYWYDCTVNKCWGMYSDDMECCVKKEIKKYNQKDYVSGRPETGAKINYYNPIIKEGDLLLFMRDYTPFEIGDIVRVESKKIGNSNLLMVKQPNKDKYGKPLWRNIRDIGFTESVVLYRREVDCSNIIKEVNKKYNIQKNKVIKFEEGDTLNIKGCKEYEKSNYECAYIERQLGKESIYWLEEGCVHNTFCD